MLELRHVVPEHQPQPFQHFPVSRDCRAHHYFTHEKSLAADPPGREALATAL
jgi:hypothetical protein